MNKPADPRGAQKLSPYTYSTHLFGAQELLKGRGERHPRVSEIRVNFNRSVALVSMADNGGPEPGPEVPFDEFMEDGGAGDGPGLDRHAHLQASGV